MDRSVYLPEHEEFRAVVRRFMRTEVAGLRQQWEHRGGPTREIWRQFGQLGILGLQVPERFGGGGQASFLYNAIVTEEAQAALQPLGGLRVHVDICMPYFLHYAADDQQQRWMPGLASGQYIAAIAMTEPGAGSDLRGISTTARPVKGGYVVNGQKTFISNGGSADLIITAVKTGSDSISLLVIKGDSTGLSRGANFEKIGLKSQELTSLHFDDVFVPGDDLLGEEGKGFDYLVHNLAQERLSLALACQAGAQAIIASTIEYVRDRTVFSRALSEYQNTKFELAACATEVAAGQCLVDQALVEHDGGTLTAADAAQVKLFCSELQCRVVDRCLQLHGGYGYMWEYPVARAFADSRASRIYGGTSEVMKLIIARALGL